MIRIAAQITTGLLVLSLSNLAFAEPVLYRAVYKADYKGLPVSAKGIRELSRSDDGTYTLSSTATSFFTKIVEVSKFKLVDEQVVPVEYQYHRSGIGKKRDAILSFDWENSKVLNNVQSKPWEMSIPEGTLDKLLYQLKMREDLVAARNEGLPWPTLDYQVADGGRLKKYQFEITGEEEIDTPVGKIKTIKAERVGNRRNRTTIFWLAPEYDFLLVRFQQYEEDGKGFELLLKEARFDGRELRGISD